MLNKLFNFKKKNQDVIWSAGKKWSQAQLLVAVDQRIELIQDLSKKSLVYLKNNNDLDSIINLLACLKLNLKICLLPQNTFDLKAISSKIGHGPLLDGKIISGSRNTKALKEISVPCLILLTSSLKPQAVIHDTRKLIDFYKKKTTKKSNRRKTLMTFPLDHMGGLNLLFKTWLSGGCVVIPDSRSVADICQATKLSKADTLPATPTLLRLILMDSKNAQLLKSVKTITYGAEMMDTETLKRVHQFFAGKKIFQTYGLTEVGVINLSSGKKGDTFFKFRDFPKNSTRIEDGTLKIKNPSFFLGYYDKKLFPRKTWFDTQDKAEARNQQLRILGRSRDMINVGGLKAFPSEIESVLMGFDKIKNVHVSKEKCPILGERVVAEIVLKENENSPEVQKEIRDFCLQRLEKHKVPQRFIFRSQIDYSDRFKSRQSF